MQLRMPGRVRTPLSMVSQEDYLDGGRGDKFKTFRISTDRTDGKPEEANLAAFLSDEASLLPESLRRRRRTMNLR